MVWGYLAIGIVAGIFGGFFGIGGATIIVPALVLGFLFCSGKKNSIEFFINIFTIKCC